MQSMTTMEKPTSKKAKSFNRFNRRQDHGDAAQREGRINKSLRSLDKDPYFHMTELTARQNADKAYLREVINDGLMISQPTSAELEAEANRILAEAESRKNVDEFEGQEAFYDHEPEASYEDQPTESDTSKMTREEYADYQNRSGRNQEVMSHVRRMGRIAKERSATLDDDYKDDDYLGDYEDGQSIR